MTDLTQCPGDPLGHQWVLHKEGYTTKVGYATKRTLFKKCLIVKDRTYGWTTFVDSVSKTWYCSKCRVFDTEVFEDDKYSDANLLKRGYAIPVSGGFTLPTITTDEAHK